MLELSLKKLKEIYFLINEIKKKKNYCKTHVARTHLLGSSGMAGSRT